MAFAYIDKDRNVAEIDGWRDLKPGHLGPCPHCSDNAWIQRHMEYQPTPDKAHIALHYTFLCAKCLNPMHYYLLYDHVDTVVSDNPVNVFV